MSDLTLAQSLHIPTQMQADEVTLRYVGSCRNDGTLLKPEHLVYVLEQVTGRSLQLRHIHWSRLIL